MNAIPGLRQRAARLNQIDGAMPRLHAMPDGCAFPPRCAQAGPRCAQPRPPLAASPAGATVSACWLHQGGVAHAA
ncbi:hypothetical protein G6F32_016941 [Rhizopus arrhizus]|nr:hypothetical protein G6F32_016941 [Rhizopus arrhizus]